MEKDDDLYFKFIIVDGKTHYKCINHKSNKCPAIAITEDGKTIKITGHNSRCHNFKIEKDKFIQDTQMNLKNLSTYGKYWKPPQYDALSHAYLQNSIFKAFRTKKMIFNDELVSKINIPEEVLSKIQVLSKQDEEAFIIFKEEYSKNMYFGPLKIEWNIPQGFVVKAMKDIKPNTLLCEYTGEVIKNTRDIVSDALMEYVTINDQEYVICPNKQGNIGRFFSGINNKQGKQKQNVKSIKFRIGNKIHIALYTIKKIKSGEILYYNYNQCRDLSKEDEMDTSYYI